MKRVVVIAVLLAGCGSSAATPTPTPTTHAISGTFVLAQSEPVVRTGGIQCSGTGGYSDIAPGTQVVVKDDKGTIVGTGSLISVAMHDMNTNLNEFLADESRCTYTFIVATLPDAPFYSVEVGHRGAITYSRDQLAGQGWRVETKLGD